MPHVKKLFSKMYLNEGNPKWRDGERRWMRIRYMHENRIKECATCKKHTKDLQVHHKDVNPKNNVDSNLVVLCHSCHVRLHKQLRATRMIPDGQGQRATSS